ncbi:HET-domain-containing protein [Hypomontagnella monticulosa]|nr:HET-domain-containing protein [Hypomontagnella monticulosa]
MLVDSLTQHIRSKYRKSVLSSRQEEQGDRDESEDEDYEPPEEPYRAPAYPYRALEGTDVRLLRIVPGTGTIECLLHQIPLDEVRIFYVLSYVWGDPNQTETIIVEGQPRIITKNLHEALHQFRERPYDIGYPEDYFWIDAICINQEDNDERSVQVPRMMEIYHAGHVVVWLGPVNEPPADNLLKRLLRKVRSSRASISRDEAVEILFKKTSTMWIDWEPVDEDDNIILDEEFGDAYGAVVLAAADILQRPWFERVWTIQEACLDTYPNVYVGRHSVYLENFIKMFKYLATEHKFLYLCSGSMRMVALNRIDDLYKSSLFDWADNPRKSEIAEVLSKVIRVAGKKSCSDPRDQVYGLLGLLRYLTKGNLPEELIPDYDLPEEIIYWNYAAFLFQSLGDLDLLDCRRNELQGVPSWVPDFRYFSLGPDLRRELSVYVSSDKRALNLRGCVLGTFRDAINGCALGDIMPSAEKIPIKFTNHLNEFDEHILKPSAAAREITAEEAFNDMMRNASKIISSEGTVSFYQIYCRLRASTGKKRSRSARKRRTTSIRWKEEAIAGQLNTPFLVLVDGTILRVIREDAEVRTGDLLCVFKGAREPSLVRASGESYTFLSRCDRKSGPLTQEKFDDAFWADRDVRSISLI